MKDQHRATADEWASVKARASDVVAYSVPGPIIHELLHRVEALEATQPVKSNYPEIPQSSLVDRVACAIYPGGSGDGFREEARAAIREVAAWLRKEFPYGARGWAMRLEREAKR